MRDGKVERAIDFDVLAKKLFTRLSNGLVTYDHLNCYQERLNKVMRDDAAC